MTKGAAIAWGIAAIVVVALFSIGGIIFASYVNAYNTANNFEASIRNQYKDNQQSLGSYSATIKDAVQVPGMQTDSIVKIVEAANKARYGADGSKASMQWIQEQNPQIDQKTFEKVMTLVESGRTDFKERQTRLLDLCRAYEAFRGTFWTGFWSRIAGYPKDGKLNDYCTVVTSGYSEDAYTTHKAEHLNLRGAESGEGGK